ncbi:MAG TPA: hypothetical protein VN828_12790 [Acidobacteriaceae bacterium]|nr:hypothetical protein [Acidobacteriaceae bacterium]
MIGAGNRAGRGRQDQLAGRLPRLTHGGHHANSAHHPCPVILAIGTTSALVAYPVFAVTAAATPASAVVVGSASPNMVVYHS